MKYTTAALRFESDLTRFMKNKFGMDFIFFTGKDADKPYGYAIIDHQHKEVIKGSYAMKLSDLISDDLLLEKEQLNKNIKNPNGSGNSFGRSEAGAYKENEERPTLIATLLNTDDSTGTSTGNNSIKTRFGGQDDEDDYRRKRRRKR